MISFLVVKCAVLILKLDKQEIRLKNYFKEKIHLRYTILFLDRKKGKHEGLTVALRTHKLFLHEKINTEKLFGFRINVENDLVSFVVFKTFNVTSLAESSLNCIKLFFSKVVETSGFPHLDITSVAKILASSGLNVYSEFQTVNATDMWIKFNFIMRRQFAKYLLLKTRLPLISDHDLKSVLVNSSSFSEIKECVNLIEEFLNKRKVISKKLSRTYHTHRLYYPKVFKILVLGGNLKCGSCFSSVNELDMELNESVRVANMLQPRTMFYSVCVKGEIYVLGGFYLPDVRVRGIKWLKTVDKYSRYTDKWEVATEMCDDRGEFCARGFANKIFVLGGGIARDMDEYHHVNSCLQYDTKSNEWSEISKMNTTRCSAASTVFNGNVVVSGGIDVGDNLLKTVEAYDVGEDSWKYMASTKHVHFCHSLISVSNKMYVMGNAFYEVYDKFSDKFVVLKSPYDFIPEYSQAVLIGSKILIFPCTHNECSFIAIYDVDKNKWSEKLIKTTKYLSYFCCVKLPWY